MENFLSAVDTKKVDEIMKSTEMNVEYFNTICTQTAKKYSQPLDNLMTDELETFINNYIESKSEVKTK